MQAALRDACIEANDSLIAEQLHFLHIFGWLLASFNTQVLVIFALAVNDKLDKAPVACAKHHLGDLLFDIAVVIDRLAAELGLPAVVHVKAQRLDVLVAHGPAQFGYALANQVSLALAVEVVLGWPRLDLVTRFATTVVSLANQHFVEVRHRLVGFQIVPRNSLQVMDLTFSVEYERLDSLLLALVEH